MKTSPTKLTFAIVGHERQFPPLSKLGKSFAHLIRDFNQRGFNYRIDSDLSKEIPSTIVAYNASWNQQTIFSDSLHHNARTQAQTVRHSTHDLSHCRTIASEHHPNWPRLSEHQKKLATMTTATILGTNAQSPVHHAIYDSLSHRDRTTGRYPNNPSSPFASSDEQDKFNNIDLILSIAETHQIPATNFETFEGYGDIYTLFCEAESVFIQSITNDKNYQVTLDILNNAQDRILDFNAFSCHWRAHNSDHQDTHPSSHRALAWSALGALELAKAPYMVANTFPYHLECHPESFLEPALTEHSDNEPQQLSDVLILTERHKQAIDLYDSAIKRAKEAQRLQINEDAKNLPQPDANKPTPSTDPTTGTDNEPDR